jgi:hypothetical protein
MQGSFGSNLYSSCSFFLDDASSYLFLNLSSFSFFLSSYEVNFFSSGFFSAYSATTGASKWPSLGTS